MTKEEKTFLENALKLVNKELQELPCSRRLHEFDFEKLLSKNLKRLIATKKTLLSKDICICFITEPFCLRTDYVLVYVKIYYEDFSHIKDIAIRFYELDNEYTLFLACGGVTKQSDDIETKKQYLPYLTTTIENPKGDISKPIVDLKATGIPYVSMPIETKFFKSQIIAFYKELITFGGLAFCEKALVKATKEISELKKQLQK